MSIEAEWTEEDRKAFKLRQQLANPQSTSTYIVRSSGESLNYGEWPFQASTGVTTPRYVPEEVERITQLEGKIRRLETLLERQMVASRQGSEAAVAVQNEIIERLKTLLSAQYSGKVVAITFDGKIIVSAESDLQLLHELDKMKYPAGQIFLHRVGSKGIGGWA